MPTDQSGASTHLLDLAPAVAIPRGGSSSSSSPGTTDSITGTFSSAVFASPSPISVTDSVTGVSLPTSPATPPQASADPTQERQLYIVFLDGAPDGDRRGLANRVQELLGIDPAQDLLDNLNGFTARLTAGQAQSLQRRQGVRSVEADSLVSLVEPVNTTRLQASGSVGIAGQTTPYGVPMVWGNTNYGGATNGDKYAFVLDTGISTQTNDLAINSTYSRNFTSTKTNDWIDYQGHGTHVAGTIAAMDDADGVVGVAAGAQTIAIRVLDRRGSGQTSWIVNGINYVAGLVKTGALKDIDPSKLVANMSLGGGVNNSIDNAVRAAATDISGTGRYLRFAIAAGNSGADVDNYSPANTGDHPNVYTVSAVNSAKAMTSWSNFDNVGDTIDDCDFSAPGASIQSLGMSAGSIVVMSGTSMASPHMAGVLLMGGPLSGQPLTAPVIAGASGDPFSVLS